LTVIALGVIAVFAAPRVDWVRTAVGALAAHTGLRQAFGFPLMLVGWWAFARANRAARPHATHPPSVVQVELSTRPERSSVIAVAFALPMVSLVALGYWAAWGWPPVPAQLAVHWSFAGPDRWVSSTPANVTLLLARHAVECLLCALLAWGVLHGSRHIASSGEAAGRERLFRRRFVILLLAAQYFAVFPAWGAFLGLSAAAMRIWLTVGPLTILVLSGRLLLAGQGGARGLVRGSGVPAGDRTEDRYWAWGLLYFNRADPAFLVEKRFGVGYTFNFGHPFAWALVMLIVALPLIGRLL
jgi:uncharacterized membrane protein